MASFLSCGSLGQFFDNGGQFCGFQSPWSTVTSIGTCMACNSGLTPFWWRDGWQLEELSAYSLRADLRKRGHRVTWTPVFVTKPPKWKGEGTLTRAEKFTELERAWQTLFEGCLFWSRQISCLECRTFRAKGRRGCVGRFWSEKGKLKGREEVYTELCGISLKRWHH